MTAYSRRLLAPTTHVLARVALVVALVLGLPAAAGAAIPVTFESLPVGTTLDTEFAADGIVFRGRASSRRSSRTSVRAPPPGRRSPCRSASDASSRTTLFAECCPAAARRSAVRAGIDSPVPQTVGVVLEALDTNGFVIGTSPTTTLTSTDFRQTMTVDPPGTDNIFQFRIRTTDTAGAPIGIDDVTYTGGGTAAPDVSVSISNFDLRLLAGNTLDVPVTVTRFNESNGDVTMDTVGLPVGVTATFTPAVLSGTTTTTTMHLAASAIVATSPSPVPLTIRANPAGALIGPGAAQRRREPRGRSPVHGRAADRVDRGARRAVPRP